MRILIEKTIIEYVKQNDWSNLWDTPVVGFASVKSISNLKNILEHGHVMPQDVLSDAKCVISYYVPFRSEINESNITGEQASQLWAEAYEKTNTMFGALNARIINVLEERKYSGKVPEAAQQFDRKKLIAYWSQRHIAYAAGLGTFGLNNMLITAKGCCGRFSSVVTNLDVKADSPVKEEWCLYKQNGSCGTCIKNCVGRALAKDGFDRKACYDVCLWNANIYKALGNSYGGEYGSEVCGKCISMSPCAFR